MFDKGQAMLIWALECVPEMSAEWNEWYNLEHFPLLLQVPGFISGNRYEIKEPIRLPGIDRQRTVPKYLTYYELYDEHVLTSRAYLTNRTSGGPGMRPEWTKRMLTYITNIFGGTYRPLSDTWLQSPDRSSDFVCAIYLDVLDGKEEQADRWYENTLLPFLKECGKVKASKLVGVLASSPRVEGGVRQSTGPDRIVLCSVDSNFHENTINAADNIWKEASSFMNHAVGAIYHRMRL